MAKLPARIKLLLLLVSVLVAFINVLALRVFVLCFIAIAGRSRLLLVLVLLFLSLSLVLVLVLYSTERRVSLGGSTPFLCLLPELTSSLSFFPILPELLFPIDATCFLGAFAYSALLHCERVCHALLSGCRPSFWRISIRILVAGPAFVD